MLSIQQPSAKTKAAGPPQWDTWSSAPCDIELARAVLRDYSLKGMPAATKRLHLARVIAFGAGATGGEAIGLLSQSGIGALDVVDPDVYGDASFTTQPALYAHRGRAKALVQGERAQQINPACQVRAAVSQAQELLLRDLRKADVFLVAGDNLSLLLWAGRLGMALGKPLVQAAVHGETFSAIVRSYDLRVTGNACPNCGVGKRELHDQASRYGCDPDTHPASQQATRTMPAICHVAGALAANEVMKWLAEHASAMRGEEIVCSILAHQNWRTELPRHPGCRHARWQLEDVSTTASETTLGCLAEQLAMGGCPTKAQVRSELPWASFSICGHCGRKASVHRFVRAGSAVGQCQCGETLMPVPQGMRSVIPAADLTSCLDQPIAALGIESGEAIGMLRADQWVYFFTRVGSANHQPKV